MRLIENGNCMREVESIKRNRLQLRFKALLTYCFVWLKEAVCYIVVRPRYYAAVSVWIVFTFLYLQASVVLEYARGYVSLGGEIFLLPIGLIIGYFVCHHYTIKERVKVEDERCLRNAIRKREQYYVNNLYNEVYEEWD